MTQDMRLSQARIMQNLSIALAAIVLYLIASMRMAKPLAGNAIGGLGTNRQVIALLLVAATAHGFVLYGTVLGGNGIDLGIFNAASFAGWCIGASLLCILLWRPIGSLAVVIFPIVALMLGLAMLFPTSRMLPPGTALGIQLHIVLSIIAYGLFAIAAVQAIYLGVAEYKLRHHRPSLDFMPPLPTMEQVLFQLTGYAFILLTISLLLGAMYIADIRAQHLAHKIVFSTLAWAVFATLIIGRWRLGWRGRRAIKFVIIGFMLLGLGFFGTKIVLELILNRV